MRLEDRKRGFNAPPLDVGRTAAMLALNNAHAEELSYTSPENFARLIETALIAQQAFHIKNPGERLLFQYTTSSSSLQKKLVVA